MVDNRLKGLQELLEILSEDPDNLYHLVLEGTKGHITLYIGSNGEDMAVNDLQGNMCLRVEADSFFNALLKLDVLAAETIRIQNEENGHHD
jgi:hypothetical protein